MASNNYNLSLIILNVNGLNSSVKRYILIEWIIKQNSTVCSLQEIDLIGKVIHRLKVKEWKMIFHFYRVPKQAVVGKGTVQQEDITIYAPFVGVPNYIK